MPFNPYHTTHRHVVLFLVFDFRLVFIFFFFSSHQLSASPNWHRPINRAKESPRHPHKSLLWLLDAIFLCLFEIVVACKCILPPRWRRGRRTICMPRPIKGRVTRRRLRRLRMVAMMYLTSTCHMHTFYSLFKAFVAPQLAAPATAPMASFLTTFFATCLGTAFVILAAIFFCRSFGHRLGYFSGSFCRYASSLF